MPDFLSDHKTSTAGRRKREALRDRPKVGVLLLLGAVLLVIVAVVFVLTDL